MAALLYMAARLTTCTCRSEDVQEERPDDSTQGQDTTAENDAEQIIIYSAVAIRSQGNAHRFVHTYDRSLVVISNQTFHWLLTFECLCMTCRYRENAEAYSH